MLYIINIFILFLPSGKCFYAWTDYTYLVARGLDRKRWPGPRKYEVCMFVWTIIVILKLLVFCALSLCKPSLVEPATRFQHQLFPFCFTHYSLFIVLFHSFTFQQVKYNQKRVDNFARLRYQKSVFLAWKGYYTLQAIVKRKYQHKLAMFVKK